MNLAWGSDGVTGNALGGVYASIFRALAMLPRIGLTISLNGKKVGPWRSAGENGFRAGDPTLGKSGRTAL